MDRRRRQFSNDRGHRVGALFVVMGILVWMLSAFAPRADAAPVPPGTLGNFEVDGDQSSAPGGTIDWGDVDPVVLIDAVNPDDGLQGSSKEDEPEDFVCQDKFPTVTPGKDNLVRAYIDARVTGPDSMFLDLGFVRSDGGTQGDSHVNFEFNQHPVTSVCPYQSRSDGDLLITFDFPGNSSLPADVQTFSWDADAPDGPNAPGKWAAFSFTGSVFAEDNIDQITDEVVGGSIAARAFGEATLDLVALANQTGNGGGCLSFGFASVKSRASESQSAALQDIVGGPVSINTCGSIVVHKVDDSGSPLAGATFGLWPAASTVPPVGADGTRPSTDSIATCTSLGDGSCTFDGVDPGDYQVAELAAPVGYAIDPDVIAVSVGFRETVDVAAPFVDPRDTGMVRVTKVVTDSGQPFAVDPADLAGLTFVLEQNGLPVTTWPPPGAPAQCSLDGISLSCDIGPVPLGDYVVTEDPATLPDGVSQGPDVPVTVDADGAVVPVTITNPLNPVNINLDKAGPDTASVGDVISYTFDVTTTGEPLTITQLVEVVDLPNGFDDRCDAAPLTGPDKSSAIDPDNDADGLLEVGETWRWTCQHTVTMVDASDADGVLLKNKAEVTGADSFGRTVVDDDTHVVTILLPDLQVVKLADDPTTATPPASSVTIDAPGTALYTVSVTNVGAGMARNATLVDTLPPGTWTVVQTGTPDGDDVCPVGGSPSTGTFTCTFGDLAPGATKSVTVSRGLTVEADCGPALVNGVVVSTTFGGLNLDPNAANDTSSATVNVRCPDVGVEKTATNTPISAGQRAEWTITLTNNGPGVATDVFLVDDVPVGLVDVQIAGPDAGACSLAGNALSCDFGDVPASDGSPGGPDTRQITVSGLTDAADCGIVPNTAMVADAEGGTYVDTSLDNNSSTAEVEVLCPDVYVEKDGPAEVTAGDQITWSITFGNHGPGDAFDVTVTDELPAGLTDYQLTDPDGACSLSGSTVTCAFDDLAAGESHTISVTGTTGSTAAACGDVVNPVSISASNEAIGVVRVNNSDSVVTDVECPDVNLVKVADEPSTVSAGDPVGFSISVANAAGEDVGIARAVVVTDALPDLPGYTWTIESVVSEEVDPCTLVGLAVMCDFGDLAPGESASVHLVATHDGGAIDPEDACGIYPNSAVVVFGNGTETDQSDNSDSVTILCPGLNLGKVADADVVDAGDQIGFQITVSNVDDGQPPAEGVARDVVVTDELPGGLDWRLEGSDLPVGAECAIDAGVLTCSLGDLPAISVENAPQVTIHVVADTSEADCASYDNTASATVGNGADPADASATSTIRCPISISLDKTGDEVAHVGDVVAYDFTVTNTGGEDLLDVDLTDPECDADTIELVDDGDGDAVLAAGTWDADSESFVGGERWSYTCERTLTAEDVVLVDGEDVALNTGAVRANDADDREVTDTDPHVVEIITPGIEVVKTVDDENPSVGSTVTFTYLVTNTGDTTLFDVEVVDDQLGDVGTIDELAAGDSATLTLTMVVQAGSPLRNIGTATGADVLGKVVTDDDDALITIVLGSITLPRTGSDSARLAAIGVLLMAYGGALMLFASIRRDRRRPRYLL